MRHFWPVKKIRLFGLSFRPEISGNIFNHQEDTLGTILSLHLGSHDHKSELIVHQISHHKRLTSANAPEVSLTVWSVYTRSQRLRMLTPPFDHDLKTVKETEGVLAERSPAMVRHLKLLSILRSPIVP